MPTFQCRVHGNEVSLSNAPARVVCFVALSGGRVARRVAAARLWPDLGPARAAKMLRQNLWKIRHLSTGRLLHVTPHEVALREDVEVDFFRAERLARSVLNERVRLGEITADGPHGWPEFTRELLAGHSAEEVADARARWDRLRLLALEKIAAEALEAGDLLSAIQVADSITLIDGLNEAAHRTLVAAYQARRDPRTASAIYRGYATVLRRELGVAPGFALSPVDAPEQRRRGLRQG